MKLSLVLCALALWAVAVVNCAAPLNAPAPSVDCSTLVFSLADCLSFVTNGSKVSKPEGTCCSGLKTMLKTGPQCLCEGFKNSAQFGVVLNVTKAMALPSACSVSAPPMSNCGLPGASLDAAPAHSPKSSSLSPKSPKSRTSSPVAPAPAPATSSMGPIVAQAPAPGSGASSASISFAVLLVSLVVATCSYF